MADEKQNDVDLSATAVLAAGNTAVITGASSGIGRAACIYCATQGMNVWMLDIDAEELKAANALVISKAANKQQKIVSQVCDVSSAAQMEAVAVNVFANGGKCHFLMSGHLCLTIYKMGDLCNVARCINKIRTWSSPLRS